MITPSLKMNPKVVVPWSGFTSSCTLFSNRSSWPLVGKVGEESVSLLENEIEIYWRTLTSCTAGRGNSDATGEPPAREARSAPPRARVAAAREPPAHLPSSPGTFNRVDAIRLGFVGFLHAHWRGLKCFFDNISVWKSVMTRISLEGAPGLPFWNVATTCEIYSLRIPVDRTIWR